MFTAVDAYANIDLGSDSALVKDLVNRVSKESTAGGIVLTGANQMYDARQPGMLTPMMASWFLEKIAGARSAAISELNNAFQADAAEMGTKGIYLELERDSARAKMVSEAIDEADRFIQDDGNKISRHDRAQKDYHTMKAKTGREAVRPRIRSYFVVLFLIVVLEGFINFESFLKVPYITSPFLATGATLAVAIAIASAAHFHGIVMRQWNYLFSPHEAGEKGHAARKNDALRRLIIGAILLTVALLMVGGSRYYYMIDYILQAKILGQSAPSMVGGITFMLFGNLVAYIVAMLFSYTRHDPNPLYAEREWEFRRLRRDLEKLKAKRRAAQNLLREGEANALAMIKNHDANARGLLYGELRQQAARVEEKDQEVAGALLAYKAELVQAMGEKADKKIIRIPDGAYEELLPVHRDSLITPSEYAARPVVLGYMLSEG